MFTATSIISHPPDGQSSLLLSEDSVIHKSLSHCGSTSGNWPSRLPIIAGMSFNLFWFSYLWGPARMHFKQNYWKLNCRSFLELWLFILKSNDREIELDLNCMWAGPAFERFLISSWKVSYEPPPQRVCKCSLGNKEKLRGMKLAHLCFLCLGKSETWEPSSHFKDSPKYTLPE